MTELRIMSLSRYPVKGLSAESLETVHLTKGEFFPGDRLFAIENGPSGFDPTAPAFLPKIKFVMLMKQGRLAALQTHYDAAACVLTIRRKGALVAEGDLSTSEGRAQIESFIADYCKGELRGAPQILSAPGAFRFADSQEGAVSFVNQATLDDIERTLGVTLDPERFRANVLVTGIDAWEESAWNNRILSVGGLRMKVVKATERCAAVNVRPGSGERDLDLVRSLVRSYGHIDCGFYAEVVASGTLTAGDRLLLEE